MIGGVTQSTSPPAPPSLGKGAKAIYLDGGTANRLATSEVAEPLAYLRAKPQRFGKRVGGGEG